jgi:hypothetical protein
MHALQNAQDEDLNEKDLMKKYFMKSAIFKKFKDEEKRENQEQLECETV